MISSEAVPFSKSGGLADVVGALSTALVRLGEEVYVVLPLYGFIDTSPLKRLELTITVEMLGSFEEIGLYTTDLDGAHYYFIEHPLFSQRLGIYGETPSHSYSDNLYRYTLLNKAPLALAQALGWEIDIFHCHDWTSGFLPYLLQRSSDQRFQDARSIMTIHNLAYQGEFPRFDLLACDIEIDERLFSVGEPDKHTNMLKSGLEFANRITTVSPTYAQEIQGSEYGCNLEDLLTERASDLVGIINGIDYQEWNPLTDPFLTHPFSAKDFSGKAMTKEEIQTYFRLEVDPTIPIFAMISRLVSQKGFYELLEGSPSALEELLVSHRLQFIIIGTGDPELERRLIELAGRHENLSSNILFSNELAHRLEAGADFFLMPSRYEPCGLNQLYSLRYGTIPIARRTGGLADSIIDLDESPEAGTGILFNCMSGRGILEAVQRALTWWEKGERTIQSIRERAMAWDSSWEHSATLYRTLYEESKGRQ